jgi:hypothetical protein
MAIDSAAKRASALAGLNRPYMRLVVPDGTLGRAAALGMYSGFVADGGGDTGVEVIRDVCRNVCRDPVRDAA